MTILAAQHAPGGWEHLPLKTDDPRHVLAISTTGLMALAPYFRSAAVTWGVRTLVAERALRDDRLPWWELGHRPAFEADR